MKTLALVSAATAALLGYRFSKTQDSYQFDADFLNYLEKYGKSYATKEEYNLRLSIYQKNDKVINEWNSKDTKTHTLAHNKFSDWTEHELSRMKNKMPKKKHENANYNVTFEGDIPESVNWVEKGAVSPVDTMFLCAAGWAMAAAGSIEGSHFA